MKEFDKLFESILSETSHGNVPRIDHDDKATMYGAPVDKLVKNTKELDAKYGKPEPKPKGEAKEAPRGKHYKKGSDRLYKNGHSSDGNPEGGPRLNSDPTYKNPNESKVLEREYPAKAPKGDSFIKGGPRDGQPSRVDSRTSTTDKYVRTHKNPTTTHAKKFGKREESYIQEDGHTDISSVNKQVHTALKALVTIKDQIGKMSCGDDLPTWWMNKIAIAIDKLDSMADYLDATVPESKEEEADEKEEKKKKRLKYKWSTRAKKYQLDEKKKKADRCKRKADSVYGKKTSAYKSGAIVRCRQGKIWKKK